MIDDREKNTRLGEKSKGVSFWLVCFTPYWTSEVERKLNKGDYNKDKYKYFWKKERNTDQIKCFWWGMIPANKRID